MSRSTSGITNHSRSQRATRAPGATVRAPSGDAARPRLTRRKVGRRVVRYNRAAFVSERPRLPRRSAMPPSAHPGPLPHPMLEAHDLAARRGLARLFAGLSFARRSRAGAGGHRRQRHRQDDAAAHAGRPVRARSRAKSAGTARSVAPFDPGAARGDGLRRTSHRRSRTSSPPRKTWRAGRRSPASRRRPRGDPRARSTRSR